MQILQEQKFALDGLQRVSNEQAHREIRHDNTEPNTDSTKTLSPKTKKPRANNVVLIRNKKLYQRFS